MIDPHGLTPEQKAALDEAGLRIFGRELDAEWWEGQYRQVLEPAHVGFDLAKAHNLTGTITITSPIDDMKELFRPTPPLVNRHQRRNDARKCR